MEAKTTCHSGCGCSCGHNKGEEHPNVVLPILSFILLIVGLILDHTGQGWFSPTVKLVWYLAAFLPVGLPVIREAYHEALRKDFFTEFTLNVGRFDRSFQHRRISGGCSCHAFLYGWRNAAKQGCRTCFTKYQPSA